MDTDLDTLATALYVKIDELLKAAPQLAPWRPAVGIPPKLSDAELVTLAVMQALLGFCSEARWLRYASRHLRPLFPYLPGQSGYNKRLRAAAGLIRQADPGYCQRHHAVDRRRLAGRLHPGGVRPLPGDDPTLGAGRVGRLRLVRQPFTLVLGATAASGVHPARPAGRLRAGRRQGRGPRGPGRAAGGRAGAGGAAARAGAGGRQELLRPRVRGRPGRVGRAAGAAGPPGRTHERPGGGCSSPYGSWSSRSIRPSRASSTWSVTAVGHRTGSGFGSSSASWPSPSPSGHNHHTGQPTLRSLLAYDH